VELLSVTTTGGKHKDYRINLTFVLIQQQKECELNFQIETTITTGKQPDCQQMCTIFLQPYAFTLRKSEPLELKDEMPSCHYVLDRFVTSTSKVFALPHRTG
jgi:hypothetical protein